MSAFTGVRLNTCPPSASEIAHSNEAAAAPNGGSPIPLVPIGLVGSGLSIPFDAFEVTVLPDETPSVLAWNVPGVACPAWQLTELAPRPGYVAALAIARAT